MHNYEQPKVTSNMHKTELERYQQWPQSPSNSENPFKSLKLEKSSPSITTANSLPSEHKKQRNELYSGYTEDCEFFSEKQQQKKRSHQS